MTHRNPSHSPWRLAAAGTLIFSMGLAHLAPAHAAGAAAAAPVTQFTDGSYPAGIVYGPDQMFWLTLAGTGEIGRFSGVIADTQALPDPQSRPLDITLGADQALWFSEETGSKIGRLIPGGALTEYHIGDGARSPTAVALGQDLAVWFTEFDGNRIGRITTGGELQEFTLPHPDSKPQSIISDYDGNLWFTEWENYRIGRITPKGEIHEYEIPTPPARPADLLYGTDGNLWILFNSGKSIARFNPANEAFTYYSLPTQSASLSNLTIGPDGRIWFVGTHTVGSFDLVDSAPADLAEEALPDPVYTYRGRSQIIAGPDNDLIFTTANSSTIFRSVLAGQPALRDLQVFITYQPPVLLSAGQFQIDAEIVNWTHSAASNVVIDLMLDDDIHFASADLPGGGCADNGASVQCSLPSIDAGATVPVRFVLAADRIHAESVDRTIEIAVSSAEGDYQPANNRVVLFQKILRSLDYFNDFSNGADGYWSHQSTTTPARGLDVLGLFQNDQVNFDWGVLPYHDRARMCFDLYILGPWDGSQYLDQDDQTIIGPDLWTNYIDDRRLLVTTFSNQERYRQAFPANYPDKLHPYQTGAPQTGEFDGDPTTRDARYHFCYQLEHTNLSLNVLYMGLNLDPTDREKWAIDNVAIKIFYDASIDQVFLPGLFK